MAKTFSLVFGVVFVLVGVAGFFVNPIVGVNGFFMTDLLHNLVHLIVGIALLVVALNAPGKSGLWLKIFGYVYLLLAVLGFITLPSGGLLLGLVAMNNADHFLHVVLGLALLIAGYASTKPMDGSTM